MPTQTKMDEEVFHLIELRVVPVTFSAVKFITKYAKQRGYLLLSPADMFAVFIENLTLTLSEERAGDRNGEGGRAGSSKSDPLYSRA